MEQELKLTSTVFQNSFGCVFDSELIDIDVNALDAHELLGLADFVITDLFRNGVKRESLVRMLQTVLRNWGPEVIEEFDGITNVGWSDTPELEETLKAIVTRMLESTSAHYYTPPSE